jgi:predicted 3-demethylubiquinone-9 3-methyltransferase (glyoxalase superfamily)
MQLQLITLIATLFAQVPAPDACDAKLTEWYQNSQKTCPQYLADTSKSTPIELTTQLDLICDKSTKMYIKACQEVAEALNVVDALPECNQNGKSKLVDMARQTIDNQSACVQDAGKYCKATFKEAAGVKTLAEAQADATIMCTPCGDAHYSALSAISAKIPSAKEQITAFKALCPNAKVTEGTAAPNTDTKDTKSSALANTVSVFGTLFLAMALI